MSLIGLTLVMRMDYSTIGIVVIAISLPLIVFPWKLLLRGPYQNVIRSVRNQLLFAVLGFCLFGLWGIASVSYKMSELLGVGLFVWMFVGGWIIILHAIGLMLTIGRRARSVRRLWRLVFCMIVACALVIMVCIIRGRDQIWASIPGLIMIVLLVVALGVIDFRRYPDVTEQPQYDSLAKKIASLTLNKLSRLLGGRKK